MPALTNAPPQEYTPLIRSLAKEMRRVHVAIELVKLLKDRGIPREPEAWNQIIDSTIRKEKSFEKGWAIMEEMERDGCLANVQTLNILLAGSSQDSDYTKALLLMKKLKEERNIAFDVVTYNTLMQLSIRRGDLSKVIAMFDQIEKSGLQPDDVSYLMMLKAYKHLAEAKAKVYALGLVEQMKQKGIDINTRHYHLLVAICIRRNDPSKAAQFVCKHLSP